MFLLNKAVIVMCEKYNSFETILEKWQCRKHQKFVSLPRQQLQWHNLFGTLESTEGLQLPGHVEIVNYDSFS